MKNKRFASCVKCGVDLLPGMGTYCDGGYPWQQRSGYLCCKCYGWYAVAEQQTPAAQEHLSKVRCYVAELPGEGYELCDAKGNIYLADGRAVIQGEVIGAVSQSPGMFYVAARVIDAALAEDEPQTCDDARETIRRALGQLYDRIGNVFRLEDAEWMNKSLAL